MTGHPGFRRAVLTAVGAAVGTLALTAAPAQAAGPLLTAPALTQAAPCEEGVTRFVPERSAALDVLAAERSWSKATGSGIVVAVIDSGVSASNAHFPAGSVVAGRSLVDGPATEDTMGHGTIVASLIAARELPGRSGIIGLARDATILPVRAFTTEDEDEARLPRLVEGIRWAADNGAQVINLSLSLPSDPPALRSAVEYAVAKDIVVVASAGNRGTASDTSNGLRYPAAYPGVIGVTASNANGVVTDDNIHGAQVALAAPGTGLLFANRAWGDCGHDGAPSSSYATALVSGSVALLRQRFPQESAAQIIHRLEVTASRPQRDARDDTYGWGVVQPFEAMTWAYDGSVGGPPAPGAEPRVTPSSTPQALDLTPVPDPNADQRQTTLWLLLGTGSTVLALGMWGMIRRARRETGRA